jgi:hypothetical protein
MACNASHGVIHDRLTPRIQVPGQFLIILNFGTSPQEALSHCVAWHQASWKAAMPARHPVFGATLGRHRVRRQCSGAPMGEVAADPSPFLVVEPQWRPFRKGRGQSTPAAPSARCDQQAPL